MANLHAFGDKIMGGGSTGGGHTIWDRLKIALTQRSILQFGGTLQVTDNPTDGATVVDDSAFEISWDDWDAMSAAEQDAFCELHPKVDVLDPPIVDGTISAELMKKLWENPSPTSSFSGQTVALDLSDYDVVVVTAGYDNSSSHRNIDCFTAFVGSSGTINMTNYASSARQRNFDVTTTGIVFSATYLNGSASNIDNTACIPLAIYGIKSNINLKLSAIASDVNTAADHCMLSDGVTSVEDKIDELNANTYGTAINITAGTPYTTTKDGYVRFNGVASLTVLCSVNSYPVMQIPNNASMVMSLFVRKGMEISMTNGNAVFLPFE